MLRHFTAFHESHAIEGRENPLSFQVAAHQSVAVESLSRLRYQIKKTLYADKRFTKPEGVPITANPDGRTSKEDMDFRVTFNVPRPAAGTWDVYQVIWKAGGRQFERASVGSRLEYGR